MAIVLTDLPAKKFDLCFVVIKRGPLFVDRRVGQYNITDLQARLDLGI